MQFGTPSPHDKQNARRPDAALAARTLARDIEADPTLDLLHTCVEAMRLLQAKFVGLEVETQIKLDAAHREIADISTALGEAKQVIARGAERLQDCEFRIAQLEVGAVDAARQHGDDIAAARAEAATVRLRAETDVMGFDHLLARVTALEEGVFTKLDHAQAQLSDRDAENVLLQTQADASRIHVERLQTKLRGVEATIADQRSRISCLQNKLATATYAMRIEHLARDIDTAAIPNERDVLDLRTIGKDIISAA